MQKRALKEPTVHFLTQFSGLFLKVLSFDLPAKYESDEVLQVTLAKALKCQSVRKSESCIV